MQAADTVFAENPLRAPLELGNDTKCSGTRTASVSECDLLRTPSVADNSSPLNAKAIKKQQSFSTALLPVLEVRAMAYAHSDTVVSLISSPAFPWVFWALQLGLALAIGQGSEAAFATFAFASLAWYAPTLLTIDARMWRLLLTAPNAVILANSAVNAWACVRVVGDCDIAPATALASGIVFSVYPLACALVPLMDHDLYGILVCVPSSTFPICAVLLKFYARGIFIGDFFCSSSAFHIFQHMFSPLAIIASNMVQILALAARVVLVSKDSRAGYPQRLLFATSAVSIHYRLFQTDAALDRPLHVRGVIALHALGILASVVAVWARIP